LSIDQQFFKLLLCAIACFSLYKSQSHELLFSSIQYPFSCFIVIPCVCLSLIPSLYRVSLSIYRRRGVCALSFMS
jgi:hypothetical protein